MGPSRIAFTVAPHLQDPSGAVAVWFTDPPGAVMQFVRPSAGTLELANWLVGTAFEALNRRFPGDVKLRFVMDLGLMTGRDPKVRPIIVEATKRQKDRIVRSTIVAPQNAGAVYVASLKAAVALLRVFGVPIEIDTLTNALLTLRAAT